MKKIKASKLVAGSIAALSIMAMAPMASAVSLMVTNNVSQGTDVLPDSGFAVTGAVLGAATTISTANATGTGALAGSAADAGSSVLGTAAYTDASAMSGSTYAEGIGNWIEVANMNSQAFATALPNSGASAHADASYDFKQVFTNTAGATVNYHFDYSAAFTDLNDPALKGDKSVGSSFFKFMLVDDAGFSKTFTTTLTADGYATGDLSLLFTGTTGYIEAFTSSTADVSAVPEPGTFLLLGAGLLGMVGYRRRQGRTA